MFGSSMLDIAVGVVFVFLLLSIFATAINEVLLSLLNMRGKYLVKGISTLLAEEKIVPDGLVSKIYNHGQVFGLYEGPFDAAKQGKLPSYIPSRNFALAFLDSVAQPFSQTQAATPALTSGAPPAIVQQVMSITAGFKTAADGLAKTNPKVGIPLQSMITMAGGDAAKLQKSVEEWFNSGMDRVSGSYKYRTQNVLLWIGLALAIAINADTIHIVRQLSNDSALRQSIVAAAQKSTSLSNSAVKATDNTLDANVPADTARADQRQAGTDLLLESQIKAANHAFADVKSLGLPLGWKGTEFHGWVEGLTTVLGWLLTAVAISLGAPFWFDALNKIMVIRSTVKPTEKSQDEGSKDKPKT